MPEWQQIRLAVADGADSSRDLATQFGVTIASVNHNLRTMPDGERIRSQMETNSRYIVYDGEAKTASGWARDERICVSSKLICQRLRNGWTVEEALTRPARGSGQAGKPMTGEARELLLGYEEHFHDDPVPEELATIVALLMLEGVGLRVIARIVQRPDYIVQGWAAQGGYISPYIADLHQKIRDTLAAGANSLRKVAEASGISREQIRRLIMAMPDRVEINAALAQRGIKPVAPLVVKIDRQMTEAEIAKLTELAAMGRAVRGNTGQLLRKAAEARDLYARKLNDSGVSRKQLADVCGVKPYTINDWLSPANTYRRTLQAKAAARRTRRRS